MQQPTSCTGTTALRIPSMASILVDLASVNYPARSNGSITSRREDTSPGPRRKPCAQDP
jgi:hypothetical protein